MIARTLIFLIVLIGFSAHAQDQALTGFADRRGEILPDEQFEDETGARIAISSYFGKPFFLAFAYHSCPQLCGLVLSAFTEGLRGLPELVGNDFDVVVVSIDPSDTSERSAAAKQRYVARYGGGGSGWHFLTGNADSIHALANAAGFNFLYDPIQKTFVHPAGVFFVKRHGIVGGHIEQTTFSSDDLQKLVVGGDGDASSPWNRLCGALRFGGGARTPGVMAALRFGIVFVVIALGGAALVAVRRRRIRGAFH
ncbi:MAG TPA: SCO family protein [Rudaea sp.]|jgi:protein SCO1/2|nr:SCO family protein [Rudaea sp.]